MSGYPSVSHVLYSELGKKRNRRTGVVLLVIAVFAMTLLIAKGGVLPDPIPFILLLVGLLLPVVAVIFVSVARYSSIVLTSETLTVGTSTVNIFDLAFPVLDESELSPEAIAVARDPFFRSAGTTLLGSRNAKLPHATVLGQSVVGVRNNTSELLVIGTFRRAKLTEALTKAIEASR